MAVEEYLNNSGLTKLWNRIKAKFAAIDNCVYYVAGTHGYAAWVANKAYAVNDQVVYSNVAYYCKTVHTSGSSFDSSKWTKIATPVWTGTVSGVTALYAGMKIAYKIPITGGLSSTYLNINNLGNKYVYRNTGHTTTHLPVNTIVFLTYNGSQWVWADYSVGDNYYAATDLYCSTAAATAAKAATGIGLSYSRHNNIAFRIYFTNDNTVKGQLTLNVNGQGAKNLFINGANSGSSNYTIPAGVYWCYYDGTQWQLWTDKSIWGLKVRGDGSNLTEAFSTASSRANIATGESNATIFGKIAKWFSDLKALAFKDKVSDSDISGTISDSHIASAATWNAKQNALSTQTAYSAKGSATKVPQITTNSLGQVTGISEVIISGVTPASHPHGNIANGGTLTDTAAAAAGNDYVVIRDADNSKIQTSTIKGTDVADAVSKKHSHSTLTLSTTAQKYDGSHTLALPTTDPYTSARTPASHTHGNIANGGTLTDTAAAAAGNDYVVIRDADNSKIQTSTIKGTDVADAVSKKHSHSTLTQSEVDTGTNTTGKLVTAKVIHDSINNSDGKIKKLVNPNFDEIIDPGVYDIQVTQSCNGCPLAYASHPMYFTMIVGKMDGDVFVTQCIPELGITRKNGGDGTFVDCEWSHTEGDGSAEDAKFAHAEGSGHAVGMYSHAEGEGTTANGAASHAEGLNTKATAYNAHAEGDGSKAQASSAHAEGLRTTASAVGAHAEGNASIASGKQAHAEGYSATADGETSHAEGSLTKASGISAHAEGGATQALGKDAHSEGFNTRVNSGSTACHSEGYSTGLGNSYADGTGSHNEGYDTKANGSGAHAEGYQTKSFSTGSHSEGYQTEASSGTGAHAEGLYSVATGSGAHTEGIGTKASSDGMHAAGKYNNATSGFARVTGWGSADNSRADIERLDTEGNLWLKGHLISQEGGNSASAQSKNTPQYHIGVTNTSTSPKGWCSIIKVTLTSGYGSYDAVRINGTFYNHGGNWNQTNSYKVDFQAIVNISSDTGTLLLSKTTFTGNTIRLLKIGTRNYELQYYAGASHTDYDVYYQYETTRTNAVTAYTTYTSGSTSGTAVDAGKLTEGHFATLAADYSANGTIAEYLEPLLVIPGRSVANGNPSYSRIWQAARQGNLIKLGIYENDGTYNWIHYIPAEALVYPTPTLFLFAHATNFSSVVSTTFAYRIDYDSTTGESVWYIWMSQQGGAPTWYQMTSGMEGAAGYPIQSYSALMANQLASSCKLKVDLASTSSPSFNGTSDVTNIGVGGTLPESRGGTGKTSLVDALNKAVNDVSEGTTPAFEQDFVLAQFAGGGSSTKTYHRRRAATIATSPYRKAVSKDMGMTEKILTVKDSIPESWTGSESYYYTYQYKDFIPFRTISVNTTSFSGSSPQSCVRWFNAAKTINLSEFEVGVSYILVTQQRSGINYGVNIKNNTGSAVTFYQNSNGSSVANGSSFGLLSGPDSSHNSLWNSFGSIKFLYRSSATACYLFNSY